MGLILDTDPLTILQEGSQPAEARMAFLNRAQSMARLLYSYAELERIQRFHCKIRVLPYSQDALDRFADLQKQRVRAGTMDLRIACIALATGSLLLSRNLRDFRKVPGLIVEDWTT